jgi:beta-lactamase class A
MRTLRTFLLIAVLAACGGGGTATPTSPTPPTPVEPGPTGPTAPPPAVPSGPTAEESMTWVLETIASGKVTEADITARFSPGFLKEVPAAQVVTIFGALNQQLPPVKILKRDTPSPEQLEYLLDTASGGVRVGLEMTKTSPRQIAGLLFKPASAEAPPKTYGDAVAMLDKAGARNQLFIAEVDGGKCVPKQNVNPTTSLAIGSTFKLWVLLAVHDKLAASKGKLTWDTTLPIRDEAKSLPSGTMQNDPAGTTHTLREFATQMISVSDNTATDHLIDFVGDAGVEAALKAAKHGTPAVNIPFLRTRELFGLKLAATADELAAYRKGNAKAKRAFLAEVRKRPIDLETAVKDWGKTPRALDLEWFADARDLCNVMATLGARGKLDPETDLLKILGKNPGVEIDRAQWRYVGFKGGSEPGVMNLTWLAQRADGRWFVIVIAVNDDGKAVDEGLIVNAATGTLKILGGETGK